MYNNSHKNTYPATMVFIILPLATAPAYLQPDEIHADDADVAIPDGSDHSSRLAKISTVIVTPGETVTEDPQWMRHVSLPLFHFAFYSHTIWIISRTPYPYQP